MQAILLTGLKDDAGNPLFATNHGSSTEPGGGGAAHAAQVYYHP